MKITGNFVLSHDVNFVSAKDIALQQRRELKADDGDFILTRARGRSASKVIDAEMARLVQGFTIGKTIVGAVLEFCQERGYGPEKTLEAAYPVLKELIRAHFLVAEGSPEAETVEASLAQGDTWADFKIVRAVQVLEDSEVYQAKDSRGTYAALKVARRGAALERLSRLIAREAAILDHLGGKPGPRLLDHGVHEGMPYLASEWCEGVNGARAASRRRSLNGITSRRRLLELCGAIAEAYARLHELNVIHGDIHPGNLIIGDDDEVTILDFGFARLTFGDDTSLTQATRAGLGFYYEPEFASAVLDGTESSVISSYPGEQHILAHVIYRLLTGHDYTKFAPDRRESMRQLAKSSPEPFSRWGLAPWPDVENILRRALAKDPADRYESVRELTNALRAARIPLEKPSGPMGEPTTPETASDLLISDYLGRLDPGGSLYESGFPESPLSSLTFGSAGAAYFLYRLSCVRNDARLLSWAKLWIEKAIRESELDAESAFTSPRRDITRETIGRVALYHTETGLYAIKALIGHAMGDTPSATDALSQYASAARRPCENIDLTLGRSGVLVGCALLDDAMPGNPLIRDLGDTLVAEIWAIIQDMRHVRDERKFRFTGIAHGWSGVLYAILMWCRATERSLPQGFVDRLDQLASLARPSGAGFQWQRIVHSSNRAGPSEFSGSWCNGTAGMIHLWSLAHQMLGEKRYLELAEGAALSVTESVCDVDQLCCGRPGHAYGLLNLYKATGKEVWLDHARKLAAESFRITSPPNLSETPAYYYSLYKGPLGSALLSADMLAPEEACMPMFELEGWTSRYA